MVEDSKQNKQSSTPQTLPQEVIEEARRNPEMLVRGNTVYVQAHMPARQRMEIERGITAILTR